MARPLEGAQEGQRGSNLAAGTPPNVESSGDGMALAMPQAHATGNGVAISTAAEVQYSRRFAAVAKRVFDIIVSVVTIILLAPVMLLIAVLVRIDSPGPAFFRSSRIGRNGKSFRMLKFRTMVRDADRHKLAILHLNEAGDGLFKVSEDPRLTRLGRILRSTSLDELPQLVHVLIGQMSLVGPRPLVPEEDAKIMGTHRQRLSVRPGMTGAWQVAGASRVPIGEMVKLDCEYVSGWSLLGDLRLLIGTVPHVVRMRGI